MAADPPAPPPAEPPTAVDPSPLELPPPRRRRMVAAIVCAVVVLALTGLAAAFVLSSSSGSPHAWDTRLAPIAHQVERLRKLRFDHPVRAEFLTDKAFRKRVTADKSKLTKRDRRDLEQAEGELRALGLVRGKVDLFGAQNTLQGTDVLAFYDQDKKHIVVRGTTLDVTTKVTVAHELTHALQDQHFDLDSLDSRAEKGKFQDVLTALVEGDAVRTEQQYIGTLSQAQQDEVDRTQQAQTPDQAKLRGAGVPQVLQILDEAPYDFGPLMLDALAAAGGEQAVNKAFRDPPTTAKAFFDPASLVRHDKVGPVAVPRLAPGHHRVGDPDQFGAFGLYLTLASRLDAHLALHAADAWGGDKEVGYRNGATWCLRASFTGHSSGDTALIADALRAWVAAGPASAAHVETSGSLVLLDACDPGDAATAPRPLDAALELAVGRNDLLTGVLQDHAPAGVAECFATAVTDDAALFQKVGELSRSNQDPDAATAARINEIASSCRNHA